MAVKVTVVPGLSRAEIEEMASTLLLDYQPDGFKGKEPVDVEKLYEFYVPSQFGIVTGFTDLTPIGPGILGYTDAATKTSFVDKTLSDAQDLATIRRFRSTVAHEISHCIHHVPILQVFRSICKSGDESGLYRVDRTRIKPYKNPEWQAWESARAILMPKKLILRYIEKGYSVKTMADLFDVNPRFMEVRLDTLKIKI